MKNIKAICIKECLHVLRDRRILAMLIFMPFLQLLIYGYAVNMDVKHLATAVYDQDQTYLSRRLINALEQSAYFDIEKRVDSPRELYGHLDRGHVKAGLIVPPGFARDALSGKGVDLQMLIDGTDSNPANAALNASQAVVAAFVEKEGLVSPRISPVEFRPRLWYNPDLKSSFFMVPGLVGFLLQILIPMITATAIVREKEQGTIEQLLVTPIKPYELMIGKIIPYVGIGFVIALTIIGTSYLLFDIPVRGNPWALFVATLIFIILCLGIGLLASTLADNQQQASQVIMFFMPPSILLSGFIFPRETMPALVYYIGYLLPLTYFVKIVRGIILKGLGFVELWDQILPIVAMATIVLFLSIKRFHKRVS